jgi:hypothetical protein
LLSSAQQHFRSQQYKLANTLTPSMLVADVELPSPYTVADNENNSKCTAREQGGKPLRNTRKSLHVHLDTTGLDERELIDLVQKTG